MAQKTLAGVNLEVSEEGYLADPSQWTEENSESAKQPFAIIRHKIAIISQVRVLSIQRVSRTLK